MTFHRWLPTFRENLQPPSSGCKLSHCHRLLPHKISGHIEFPQEFISPVLCCGLAGCSNVQFGVTTFRKNILPPKHYKPPTKPRRVLSQKILIFTFPAANFALLSLYRHTSFPEDRQCTYNRTLWHVRSMFVPAQPS